MPASGKKKEVKKRKKRYSKRFATKPTPQQRSREKRAREAAYRLIVKEEKAHGNPITIKEARQIYKDNGLVEFLFERPKKYARRRFVKVSPTKFREIPEGKPAQEQYATGLLRDFRYVVRVRRMKEYWNFVDILSQEYRISIKEARDRIKKGKALGLKVRAMEGFLSGEYPITSKLIEELFG